MRKEPWFCKNLLLLLVVVLSLWYTCFCFGKLRLLSLNAGGTELLWNVLTLFCFHNLSTFFLSIVYKFLFSPVDPMCLSLPCFPEQPLCVLLALLFQFITQPPLTMTHASCQSLWPVWEPATAVQSFTYWTMVRWGMTYRSKPPYGHLLVVFVWR